MNTNMMEILEHLLTKAGKSEAIECQVVLPSGPVMGALKRSAVPGIYQMLAPLKDGERGNKLSMVEVYFSAQTVLAVYVPYEQLIEAPTNTLRI